MEDAPGTISDIQWWMQMDATPFPEIRQILTEELHRSPGDVQGLAFKNEIEVKPSADGEWMSHAPTGKSWITLTFPDEKITFEKDSNGVRLGKLPEDNVMYLGDDGTVRIK